MKLKIAVLTVWGIVAAIAAGRAGSLALAAQAQKTPWDGIYTDAQAKRGDAVYADKCASCHGPEMGGKDDAPALVGAEFTNNWLELSVAAMYERIRTSMPQTSPGSLTRPEVADVIAAILKKGKYPAGAAELPPNTDILGDYKFVEKKP